MRADRIGDEFGVQYIIKGGGNEYQRIEDIAATKASFIYHLTFRRHRMWMIPMMQNMFLLLI